MPTNKSSDNLIKEVINLYHCYLMKEKLTSSSTTEPSISVEINGPPSKLETFNYINDEQTARDLHSLIKNGHTFSKENVYRNVSIHQNRLKDAKAKLLDEVLRKPNNAYAREAVISGLGMALNYQIDINPLIHDQSVPDNINKKLQLLGLKTDNSRLCEKYNFLNKYYNAVKHRGRPENVRNAQQLMGTDGLIITIDFFETVRKIFRWYYRKYAKDIPDWDELKVIKYSNFNIKYSFRYERLW